MIDGVYGFDREYSWLSNFYVLTVPVIDEFEIEYNSTEAFYQAHKSTDRNYRSMQQTLSPSQSKKAGRAIVLREDWEAIKVDVMRDAIRQKFTRNEDLKHKLLCTGDLYLEETNWWHDTFWGVCNGKGQNVLGNLLMELREEMKREA